MTASRFRFSFRIQYFLTVFCLLFLLFISMLLFLIPYKLYTRLYISQAEYYCNNFLAQSNLALEKSLTDFDKKIQEVLRDSDIQEILRHEAPDSASQYNYQIAVSRYFQPHTMDEYYLQEMDLYIKESGESLYYGTKPAHLSSPFSSSYYQKALTHPTRPNWLHYNAEMDCIELSAVAYDKNTYAVQGLAVIRLSTDFLLDTFNAYNTLDIDRLYIADQYGQILCTTEQDALGLSLDSLQAGGTSRDFTGKDHIAILRPLSKSNTSFPYDDWTSVILLDRHTLLQSFQQIAWLFYMIFLSLLGFSIAVALRSLRFITQPVAALVSAMKNVEEGYLDHTLPESYPLKEISFINRGFNQMVSRLNTLINNEYKSRLAQQEAQLKALQSQINPHFLFNTLQLISWKAYEYEATPVCDMLGSLSYMLQTDLCSDDEKTFTLREEVEYIRQYGKIIQCKYNDKIQIVMEVPEELLDCRIPKLILQPFLENSITHGLAPKLSPGKVWLRITCSGGQLHIVIKDDGIGIRSSVLHSLRHPSGPPDRDAALAYGHHIALANIQERIHLLYGDQYGFHLESQLNAGTVVTLNMPYMIENGGELL